MIRPIVFICAALAPAMAVGSQTCSALDIPACIGWQVICANHAPDIGLNFTPLGVDATYLSGPNLLTSVSVSGSYTETGRTGGVEPVTSFTTDLGIEGTIKVLQTPSCSDGHFFDSAPFELTITAGPNGSTMQPGQTFCCIFAPN